VVSNATGRRQQICRTSVAGLARQERLPAPALLIIGRIAAQNIDEISETFWRDQEHPSLGTCVS
jgi:siroheme synthase